jgi:hypothetical protein
MKCQIKLIILKNLIKIKIAIIIILIIDLTFQVFFKKKSIKNDNSHSDNGNWHNI